MTRKRKYLDDNPPAVLYTDSEGLPHYKFTNDATVEASALPKAKATDANIQRYAEAVEKGQIKLSQIPDTELRNKVRAVPVLNQWRKDMNRNGTIAAAGLAGTVAAPYIISGATMAAPVVSAIMNNPIVDAGLTVHGAIEAPKNIKEGVQEMQEGNYGKGALDLGLTALDLYGAGRLGKHIYNFPRKLANNMYRYFSPFDYRLSQHKQEIKDVTKAMLFDNDLHDDVRLDEFIPKWYANDPNMRTRDPAYRSWLGFEPRKEARPLYRELTKEEEAAAKAAGLWRYDKPGRFGQKYRNLAADESNLAKFLYPNRSYDLYKEGSYIAGPDKDWIDFQREASLKDSFDTHTDWYLNSHGGINSVVDDTGQKWVQDVWDINPLADLFGRELDLGVIFPNHKAINWIQKVHKLGGSLNRHSLKHGGIYIQPSHRGRFTALKKRTGHSTSWFKEHGTPAEKKMATFALNAAKWNH